jgi:sugar phosphate isomerase/epimerase
MAGGAEEFGTKVAAWAMGGLSPRAVNVLFPASIKVVGPDVDPESIRSYLEDAMSRVRRLGVKIVVFGSGGSRMVPAGFPRAEAYTQFRSAIRMVSETAGPDVTVCVEHLRRAETNLVNSLAEAGELVQDLALSNVALVVDAYHLQEEAESPSVVRRFPDRIAHVHMCGPERRPPDDHDVERLTEVFGHLGAVGYRGRVSIECRFRDIKTEAPPALATVRRAAEAAGFH